MCELVNVWLVGGVSEFYYECLGVCEYVNTSEFVFECVSVYMNVCR